MNSDGIRRGGTDGIGEKLVRSSPRSLLVFAGGLLFMLVVGALPVVTRIYPGLPISFPALLGAAIAMGFAWLLAEHATRIRMTLARVALGEFPDMDRGTRVIVENTVLLTAILVGYLGIATITSPILKPVDAFWLSSLVFWVFALGPLVMIGYHLNPVLDSIADRLADGILRIL